jgi:GntR family transcriptional regulator, carbon starvation induced regulator
MGYDEGPFDTRDASTLKTLTKLRQANVADQGGTSASRTLTEHAYDLLRRDIITGTLSPEIKLQTESLKAKYGLGGSTLREALARLTSEALVTFEGQRGFRVAPMSRDDFADLCDVRKMVEIEAMRQSITKGDDEWESRVVAAFHSLSKVEDQMPDQLEEVYEAWEVRNRTFHKALISACPSRWLHRIHDLLLQQAERYRRITFASGRLVKRNVQQEHRAIMEAAIARDVDAACGLAASHIQRTMTVFDQLTEKNRQQ